MDIIAGLRRRRNLRLGAFVAAMAILLILRRSDAVTYAQQPSESVPTQPSLVWTDGGQLMVQRRRPDNSLDQARPYTIKGVNWSPASICTERDQRAEEFAKWYDVDIPPMAAMGVNTVRTFDDFGTGTTATHILDEFYANDIMVIMTVDRTIADADNITRTVNAYKEHPAILMWAIGNEWDLYNYDGYGGFTDTLQSAAFTEWAAETIHDLDTAHPVASVLADIIRGPFSAAEIVADLVPDVDVWGINVYRGASFGGLFGQWRRMSTKPMFIAEFGADSYDHRISAENQSMQGDFDRALWREVFLNLSATQPTEPCFGGLVFEWNDEWWKTGTACAHDISGETNPGQPDGYNDEEYFGIVDISRQPKQAYAALGKAFSSNARITVTEQVTLAAYSGAYSQFFVNGVGFCYAAGAGGGGRGLNVAVIDPRTGGIEDCRSLDAWQDRDELVNLSNYLNDDDAVVPGSVVMIAIADDAGFIAPFHAHGETYQCLTPHDDARVEVGYKALEDLGSTQIRKVGYWGSWAMIAVKGQGVLAEDFHNPVYARPVQGWCRLESGVATQISATMAMDVVYPSPYRLFLPVMMRVKTFPEGGSIAKEW
jgi:hypothetical protein